MGFLSDIVHDARRPAAHRAAMAAEAAQGEAVAEPLDPGAREGEGGQPGAVWEPPPAPDTGPVPSHPAGAEEGEACVAGVPSADPSPATPAPALDPPVHRAPRAGMAPLSEAGGRPLGPAPAGRPRGGQTPGRAPSPGPAGEMAPVAPAGRGGEGARPGASEMPMDAPLAARADLADRAGAGGDVREPPSRGPGRAAPPPAPGKATQARPPSGETSGGPWHSGGPERAVPPPAPGRATGARPPSGETSGGPWHSGGPERASPPPAPGTATGARPPSGEASGEPRRFGGPDIAPQAPPVPRVHIGLLEITVLAPEAPAPRPAGDTGQAGLSSRLYLRSL